MSIDRRVARTQAALHRALMGLIREKGYEAITVQNICDAASVGKSTFYAHYTGKDDLKRSGLEHMRRVFVGRLREARASAGDQWERPLGFSLPLLEHVRDHLGLDRRLGSSRHATGGGSVALGVMRQVVFDFVRDELVATTGPTRVDAIERELAVQYIVGAYMAVLTWWLDGGAKLPPQEVDEVFRRLAKDGICSLWSTC